MAQSEGAQQYETPSTMAQRVLFGAFGSSSGMLPLPVPTNTPGPTWIDDLLPMMTLGCGVAECERVPSVQMIEVSARTPWRPSSQVTMLPSRLQTWAKASDAPERHKKASAESNSGVRVMRSLDLLARRTCKSP